ncbi:unnamed protein product, partial [Mesorhabditis belari]|uniref:MATH domain-containing protein n=1 Tax=Mesorhabditis belari TaxID=2138241 RepID=A0AAF3E8M4_9BILA
MHDEGGEAGGSCGHSAAQHDDPSGATAQQMLNDSISEGISSPHECGGSTTRKESSPFARFPRYSHDLRHHPPCGHNLRSKRLNGISVACQTDSTDEFPREQNLLAVRAAQTEASSSSSEGVLRLMIQNFPNMNDTVRGPSKKINGVQWKIMVMPRQHVVQKKRHTEMSRAWQCQASAELRLISQKPGVNHFTRKTNHIYTAKENDWGYSCFMTWADILEEDQGYIKDGRVVLEVSVKADTPKNILTYEDFQKQIQSWYDLAELQQQRGFIDLALEANAQALKFCKDRDAAIKERLEEQKKFFVERKLVESIQRIEQKGTLTSVPDDENASQNAVRLALTQNTAQKIPAVKGGKMGRKNPTNKKKNRASTPPGNPPTENKDDSKDGDEKVDVKSGRFSKNVLLRGHREDSYANLAKQFYEMPPEAIQLDEQDTRDGLSYMFDQLFHVARLDYPNKFNSTPLDMELQRQLIIKKATMFVEAYMERVNRGEDLVESEPEEAINEMDLSNLWQPTFKESTEDRAFIIEKNMGWLDAKVRLFWLEDDCSFSDGASCSSESDSGSGDGPQLKRSRCDVDERCDHCILAEKLEQLYFVGPKKSDSECQTEPFCETVVLAQNEAAKKNPAVGETVPVPTVRLNATQRSNRQIKTVTKKNTAVSGKAAANAQVISQQLAAMQQAQLTQPPIPPPTSMMPPPHEMLDASQFVQGLAAAHLASMPPPPGLSTEDLEKQFRECTNEMQVDESTNEFLKHTFARVWTMMRGFDDQTVNSQLNPEVPNVYEGNLYNPYPGQVLPNQQVNIALSVIAVCCLNAKKAEEKLSAITQHIDKKIRNPDVQTALRSLCKLGDMVVVEDDEDSGSPLHNEDKHGGEDYLLSRHLARLDNLQQKAEKYAYYIHNKDGERLMQAVAAVEQKFLTLEKEKVKMQKQVEEHKKEVEKAEKTLTKHLSELRQEKDIKDKLNNQLKEKNKEIKKFEKRIKELTVMAEEKDELREQKDNIQKDLSAEKKKYQESENRLKKETAAKEELRRHLQNEINGKDSEHARLMQAHEELKQQMKKMETAMNAEKQKMGQVLQQTQERAKKAELVTIELVYEHGVRKLDRGREDATINMNKMDEAATRAGSTAQQQTFLASRDEWKGVLEEIQRMVEKARVEYSAQVDALKKGKQLSEMTKFLIPKPPPAPKIITIPSATPAAIPTQQQVVLPPEPPKASPGVIGSRTNSTASQLPAPIGTNISPKNKAPGSPIQKPVATVASQPQTASPCRHPGAIGSRANGNEATPSTAAAPGTASNLNMGGSWHWNDFSLSDNLLGNRGFGPLTDNFSASASTSTNPAPTTTTHATTTNGWSGDGWNQKTPTAVPPTANHNYLGSLGTASPSYAVWENPGPRAQQPPQQANIPQPPQSQPPPHTAAPGAPIQQNQRITQKYGGEEAFKHQTILEQVSEIFRHVEKKKLVNLSNEYCYQNQTNFQHEPIPIAVKILEKYITQKLNNETNDASNRRVMGTPIQPPPDMPIRQTPNQMMGTYNTMMDNSLLNGDATRSVIGADKWSLQNL